MLPEKTDSHKDSSVRNALGLLGPWAKRLGVSVVLIRHLTKGGGSKAMHRGMGSVAFMALARVGLVAALDPDDPTGQRRVLVGGQIEHWADA